MARVRRADYCIVKTDTGEVLNKDCRFFLQGNHEKFISIFTSFLRRVETKPAGEKYTFQFSVSDYTKAYEVVSEPKLFDDIPSIF